MCSAIAASDAVCSEAVRKCANLSESSRLRCAVSEVVKRTLMQKASENIWADKLDKYPPVITLIYRLSDSELRDLDADLGRVLGESKNQNLLSQLKVDANCRWGDWYGGLFEVSCKANALRSGELKEFDRSHPNQYECDISLLLNTKSVNLECTVLTTDDEDREVTEAYVRDWQKDHSKTLVRPGPYCPPNAKGPSVYYDAWRTYLKIYDKLARGLNPAKSQFPEGEPNILLLSLAGPHPPGAISVGWVLDELFAVQPRIQGQPPPHLPDISLEGWIKHEAQNLVNQKKLTPEEFCSRYQEIIDAPRRLGGILLFENAKLVNARLNYNADDASRLSHADMADLETIFSDEPTYFR